MFFLVFFKIKFNIFLNFYFGTSFFKTLKSGFRILSTTIRYHKILQNITRQSNGMQMSKLLMVFIY